MSLNWFEFSIIKKIIKNPIWLKIFEFVLTLINFFFRCGIDGCTKSFRNSHHLKSHNLSHTGERPYACQDSSCGRTFAKRNSWKVHLAKHGIYVGRKENQSGDEGAGSIGRQVLSSANPDEIRLTTVPSNDGVQAFAVIPLSAESVNRMTQRSGLSLQQLLTDRSLALAPMDEVSGSGQSSNVEDSSDSSSMDEGNSSQLIILKLRWQIPKHTLLFDT